MFDLPSIPNLIISTIVFMVVLKLANRILDAQGIAKRMTRSMSVFALAYLLSWGFGDGVDWAVGTPVEAKTSGDLSQVLRAVGQYAFWSHRWANKSEVVLRGSITQIGTKRIVANLCNRPAVSRRCRVE